MSKQETPFRDNSTRTKYRKSYIMFTSLQSCHNWRVSHTETKLESRSYIFRRYILILIQGRLIHINPVKWTTNHPRSSRQHKTLKFIKKNSDVCFILFFFIYAFTYLSLNFLVLNMRWNKMDIGLLFSLAMSLLP